MIDPRQQETMMATPNPITRQVLEQEYKRVNQQWLYDNGIGQFNRVIYIHNKRNTILICCQRPKLRENSPQNFILWLDSLEYYYRWEKGLLGPGWHPKQIKVFLVDENFEWKYNNYPEQHQILAGGRTKTWEQIRDEALSLHREDQLFTIFGKHHEMFFMDDNFELVPVVGVYPKGRETRRNRDERNGDSDHGFGEYQNYGNGGSTRQNRQSPSMPEQVAVAISDKQNKLEITIEGVSAREVLAWIEQKYPDCEVLPY